MSANKKYVKNLAKMVTMSTIFALSSIANAATVTLPSLTANPANTITSGDLVFDQFTISNQGSNVTLDFANITVTDITDNGDGAGIRFDILDGMFDLIATEGASVLLTYRVTTTKPSLSSAFLGFGGCTASPTTGADCTGVSKSGNGSVNMTQLVAYNANFVQNILDNGGFNASATDAIPTTPLHPMATVQLFVDVAAGTGTAALLSYEERYETTVIPVPAALWLFGSGLLAMFGISRRKA